MTDADVLVLPSDNEMMADAVAARQLPRCVLRLLGRIGCGWPPNRLIVAFIGRAVRRVRAARAQRVVYGARCFVHEVEWLTLGGTGVCD